MKRIIFGTIVLSCLLCIYASAEEDKSAGPDRATSLDRIVVTPSRFEESILSSSTSVSVVDKSDFSRKEINTVSSAIKDETGLNIVQSGAFQGPTSLFMRGGNANHTLILIDGMKAYDPSTYNGAYNLTNLTLDNVDRVEVLRGAQSALYGSDAMSGVVSIISKKAQAPYMEASFEGGSFSTYTERFECGAETKGFHYSIAASRIDTKGISQAEAKNNNQEHDPYDRTSVAVRTDYDINDNLTVGGTLRHTDANYEYDSGFPFRDDDNSKARYMDTFITTYVAHKPLDVWDYEVKMGWAQIMRMFIDDDPPANNFLREKYFGKYFTLNYQNNFHIGDIDTIVIGYEHNEEISDSYSDSSFGVTDQDKAFDREDDVYVENRFNYKDRLTSTQSMRVSHHSRAGTFTTYRIDASYALPTATKIRGAIATGFKAPTLYQLFAPANPMYLFNGGNPNLEPEKSFSYEYGLDQPLFNGKALINITYFHTIYKNLINALYHRDTGVTDMYSNIGKARARGVEFSAKCDLTERIVVRTGVTLQKTKNFQDDRDLLRRPDKKIFVETTFRMTDKLSFNMNVSYNGPMADSSGYKVKEYTVVGMVANYDLTRNISIYGKIDNALNKHYEEVVGYSTLPFAAYGGVKAKF